MIFTKDTIDNTLFFNCLENVDNYERRSDIYNEEFLEIVNECNGIIYGSAMTAYMMNSPTLNSSRHDYSDVDIIFLNHQSLYLFVLKIMEYIEKKDYYKLLDPRTGRDFYSFSDQITKGTQMTIPFFKGYPYSERIKYIDVLRVNIQNLNENMSGDIIANALFEKFLPYDFSKVIYYKGKIYSAMQDLTYNVKLRQFDFNQMTTSPILVKYSSYGFNYTLIPENNAAPTESAPTESAPTESAPTESALTKAKKLYQSLGLVVIPLSKRSPGKVPGVAKWHLKTKDYDFDADSHGNIGILCGKESGIVCIDVDEKDNGMLYFDKMINKYGLPEGPVQITPNNGRHYIFKYDHDRMVDMNHKIKGAKVDGHRIGIDFWIQKCQFVVSPSINYENEKQYVWKTPITSYDSIPHLPEWIYDLYENENISEEGLILKTKERTLSEDDTCSSFSNETDSSIAFEMPKITIDSLEMMIAVFTLAMMILQSFVFLLIVIVMIYMMMPKNWKNVLFSQFM